MVIGISVGLLIGFISGLALWFLLKAAWGEKSLKNILTVVGEILGFPGVWFASPWVTSKIFASFDPNEWIPFYILSLACLFIPIGIFEFGWMLFKNPSIAQTEKTSHA